jgi:hypothetical protein
MRLLVSWKISPTSNGECLSFASVLPEDWAIIIRRWKIVILNQDFNRKQASAGSHVIL